MENFKVAITTRNRPDELERVLIEVTKYVNERDIIIVDDASDIEYCRSDYRFENRAGIPRSKNKCLEIFMRTNAGHLFLLDDDVWPLIENAFKSYIESPYDHLCYTFLPPNGTLPGHKTHVLGNGCMLYLSRKCIDTVGGLSVEFGLGKYEHSLYSRQVHKSGLIPHPFIDVIGSDKLWYCLDQEKGHKRSFTEQEMTQLLNSGRKHFYDSLKKPFAFTNYID